MGATRTSRERWIEEGLRVLAADGPDAVRVEVLAKRLGVTKGGFYGMFTDRLSLLTAMLDTWERESVDEVLEAVKGEGRGPRERIERAGALTFSSDRLLPLDLAVRQWARRDDAVARRLRLVDERRLDLLRELIASFCGDPVEVEARSLLVLSASIGRNFLSAGQGGSARPEVAARILDLLLDRTSPVLPPDGRFPSEADPGEVDRGETGR